MLILSINGVELKILMSTRLSENVAYKPKINVKYQTEKPVVK